MANWGLSTGASGYDAKDRLVTWNRTDAGRDQSWTLTYEGDWQQFTDAAVTEHRTHGPAHELTAIDSTSLTYDPKGNLTQNVCGDTYTWDFDNRMQTATVSGAVSTYSYDALGRRASKEVGGTTNVYVSARERVIGEYVSTAAPSSPTEKYVYASFIDEPIIKVGTGGTIYYHANDLFSIDTLTDTNGSPIERYAYTAYGVLTILAPDGKTVRSSSSYANPYTFTGRKWDLETGLYYFRARYYDPALGRFMSRDPIEADGPNLYAIARNNPNGSVDPSGLQCQCIAKYSYGTPAVRAIAAFQYISDFMPGPDISPSPQIIGLVKLDIPPTIKILCRRTTGLKVTFKCCKTTSGKIQRVPKPAVNFTVEEPGLCNWIGVDIFVAKGTLQVVTMFGPVIDALTNFVGVDIVKVIAPGPDQTKANLACQQRGVYGFKTYVNTNGQSYHGKWLRTDRAYSCDYVDDWIEAAKK